MGDESVKAAPATVALPFELSLLGKGEASDASEANKGLGQSGLDLDLTGRVGLVDRGRRIYELMGFLEEHSSRYTSGGFRLDISNELYRPTAQPRPLTGNGLGFAPQPLPRPLGLTDERLRYQISANVAFHNQKNPTIDTPAHNLFFGLDVALRSRDIHFLASYLDTETVYESNLPFISGGSRIVAPWQRYSFQAGFDHEFSANHRLTLGYRVGLDVRGFVPRVPHGPSLLYEGRLGDVTMGTAAHTTFMRNFLQQDYEITYAINPFIIISDPLLRFDIHVGNDNPYTSETRFETSASWQPYLFGDVRGTIAGRFKTIDTSRETIFAGIVELGLTYGAGFDELVYQRLVEGLLETPLVEEDEAMGDELPSRYFLYGDFDLRFALGTMYYRFPFSRSRAQDITLLDIPPYIDRLPDGIAPVEAVEDGINSFYVEQGPVRISGGIPDTTVMSLAARGNLYSNRSRTWQLFWTVDANTLWMNNDRKFRLYGDAGVGIRRPYQLGGGWAIPVSLAAGVGLGAELIGADATEANWFAETSVVERVWGDDDMRYSAGLIVRGSQSIKPFGVRISEERGFSFLQPTEFDTNIVVGVAVGWGDTLEEYTEPPPPPEPPPCPEPPPPPKCPPQRPCPPPPGCPKPRVETRVEVRPIEVKQFVERLNGFLIRFKLNEPAPIRDGRGYDAKIRNLKEAALGEGGPRFRFDPTNPDEVSDFLVVFKPDEAILFESEDSLRLVRVAEMLGSFLEENPTKKIILRGYTSSEGTERHNQHLSANRAQAMYYYLIMFGIDAKRLEVRALGEQELIFPEEQLPEEYQETARNMNRRVIFDVEEM